MDQSLSNVQLADALRPDIHTSHNVWRSNVNGRHKLVGFLTSFPSLVLNGSSTFSDS